MSSGDNARGTRNIGAEISFRKQGSFCSNVLNLHLPSHGCFQVQFRFKGLWKLYIVGDRSLIRFKGFAPATYGYTREIIITKKMPCNVMSPLFPQNNEHIRAMTDHLDSHGSEEQTTLRNTGRRCDPFRNVTKQKERSRKKQRIIGVHWLDVAWR